MASFNKVILVGNLTRDPELKYLPSQTSLVEFGLAMNRKWVGQDGQKNEDVCFVDCTCFGKQAENLNKYTYKGDSLLVEGRLHMDTWKAQDGSNRSKLKVVIEKFTFMPKPGQAEQPPGGGADPEIPF